MNISTEVTLWKLSIQ